MAMNNYRYYSFQWHYKTSFATILGVYDKK